MEEGPLLSFPLPLLRIHSGLGFHSLQSLPLVGRAPALLFVVASTGNLGAEPYMLRAVPLDSQNGACVAGVTIVNVTRMGTANTRARHRLLGTENA